MADEDDTLIKIRHSNFLMEDFPGLPTVIV